MMKTYKSCKSGYALYEELKGNIEEVLSQDMANLSAYFQKWKLKFDTAEKALLYLHKKKAY